MTDRNWDTYSEDMEEDLIMEDEIEDEDMDLNNEKTVYPEDFPPSSSSSSRRDRIMTPRFNQRSSPSEFARFDTISPVGFGEGFDEKGEHMMHLEKNIVHQSFEDNFQDDFDEEDYA